MKTLGKVLSSAARTDILRVLACQDSGIGVRQIARLADVQLRSAQVALHELCKGDLVICETGGTHPLYRFNVNHEAAPILVAAFDGATRAVTKARSLTLQTRACSLLAQMAEATRLLEHGRGSHAT